MKRLSSGRWAIEVGDRVTLPRYTDAKWAGYEAAHGTVTEQYGTIMHTIAVDRGPTLTGIPIGCLTREITNTEAALARSNLRAAGYVFRQSTERNHAWWYLDDDGHLLPLYGVKTGNKGY